MQWGYASKSIAAGATDDVAVTFSVAFTAAPTITMSHIAHVPDVITISGESYRQLEIISKWQVISQ